MHLGEVAGYINMENVIEVRKEPLTANPSPFVLDSDKATLNIIDKGVYIFSSELPPACKVKSFFWQVLSPPPGEDDCFQSPEVHLNQSFRVSNEYCIHIKNVVIYHKVLILVLNL